MRYKCRICRGGADRNICYIHIVGRSHSDPSQKYLDVSDFLKNISDLENRDFRFKGGQSEKFEVNNEDSLFNEETSLFSSFFSLFPTIKLKNAFFEVAKFFFGFFFTILTFLTF